MVSLGSETLNNYTYKCNAQSKIIPVGRLKYTNANHLFNIKMEYSKWLIGKLSFRLYMLFVQLPRQKLIRTTPLNMLLNCELLQLIFYLKCCHFPFVIHTVFSNLQMIGKNRYKLLQEGDGEHRSLIPIYNMETWVSLLPLKPRSRTSQYDLAFKLSKTCNYMYKRAILSKFI